MKYISFLLISFLFIRCSVSKPVVLQPTGTKESIFWYDGGPVYTQQYGDIVSNICFAGYDRNWISFDVTYTNVGSGNVEVDPSGAMLYAVDTASGIYYHLKMASADSLISATENDLAVNQKKQATSNVIGLILGVATIAADVSLAVSSKNYDQKAALHNSLVAAQATKAVGDLNRDNKEQALFDELDYRKEWLLRRNTLEPNRYVSGRIQFPAMSTPAYVLYLPVNGSDTVKVRFDRRP